MTQKPLLFTRRQFLRQAATSALAAPFLARGLLAVSPNEMLNHASFGANGMAWSDLTELCKHPSFRLAAVAKLYASKVIVCPDQHAKMVA